MEIKVKNDGKQKAPKLNFQDFFYILICKLKINNLKTTI